MPMSPHASPQPSGPPTNIVCVDCGGTCHRLTPPREDGSWMVGDIVAYRCQDCFDRWDLVLEPEDVDAESASTRGDDYPMV